MIKAIFFDIGGILALEDRDKQYSQLAKIMNFNLEEFQRIRRKNLSILQKGKISEKEYLDIFAKEFKLDIRKLKIIWIRLADRNFKIDRGIQEIIKNLKKNYILGALTNITRMHNSVREKYKIYGHFKIKLLSFEQRLSKPDIRFYKIILKKTRLKPEEIIFIDDYEPYLKPAKKLGMNVILFKNKHNLINELKRYNIVIK